MTQLELAKAAKTTVRVVSALEQGVVQSIKLGVAIRMARVLSGSSMNACASVVAWLLRLDDGAQPAKGVRR
jgi:transcriptional regulator with XRE-family HTH domain